MPLFANERDLKFIKNRNKEYYKLMFLPVDVYKPVKSEHNKVYGEDLNRVFELAYSIEAYIPDLRKYQQESTKFGLDEKRNLTIFFSQDLLIERGVIFPEIGDKIRIQNEDYKIMITNPVDYSSNLQIPLSHVCELQRVIPEVIEQGSTTWKNF